MLGSARPRRLLGGASTAAAVSGDDGGNRVATLVALDGQDVHVWRGMLRDDERPHPAAWRVLSSDERERADSFRFGIHRSRFVQARALLRRILARYLEADAASIVLGTAADGKPRLLEPDGSAPLRFNVSHSESVALVAVARHREIGVDVERVRDDFAWEDVADRWFPAAEVAAIRRVEPAHRTLAFFRCWVRREAYLKGLGTGLRDGLGGFGVTETPDGGLITEPAGRATGGGPHWYVHELDAGPGYAAALAAPGVCRVVPAAGQAAP
jgi:4'-phosphopantetheinyl transferase